MYTSGVSRSREQWAQVPVRYVSEKRSRDPHPEEEVSVHPQLGLLGQLHCAVHHVHHGHCSNWQLQPPWSLIQRKCNSQDSANASYGQNNA